MKTTMVRLPDKTGKAVEEYALERGLAFATAVRCIVVEHMNNIATAANNIQRGGALIKRGMRHDIY